VICGLFIDRSRINQTHNLWENPNSIFDDLAVTPGTRFENWGSPQLFVFRVANFEKIPTNRTLNLSRILLIPRISKDLAKTILVTKSNEIFDVLDPRDPFRTTKILRKINANVKRKSGDSSSTKHAKSRLFDFTEQQISKFRF
jgi:hypothetical protein